MKLFNLTKNRLIKTAGILAILYFALFSNKDNPRSLGNRLSSENISKGLKEAKEKSDYIIENVKMAQSLSKDPSIYKTENSQPKAITIQDLNLGSGEASIACSDEAIISYAIYTNDSTQVDFVNTKQLTVGSKSESLIEENIIGMKVGGVRSINVSASASINDQKLINLIKKHNSNLKIQVTLLSIIPSQDKTISCK